MKIENKERLDAYIEVSNEIKHVTNSIIRLRILYCLYDGKKTMKEINEGTHLSYSAISTTIRSLELEKHVFRDGGNYYLSNVMNFYLKNLLEFDKTFHILVKFSSLFDEHKVRKIPTEVIKEMYLLDDSELVESSGTDIYKINEVIMDTLKKSDEMKAVLPISFKSLTKSIKLFVENGKKAELKMSNDISEELEKSIDFNKDNVQIKEFEQNYCFLLLIANETMILGLYRKDGVFDQNRILISKSQNCLKWADKLFCLV